MALLFAFCGVCTALDVSPLLGCMSAGMVCSNATGHEKLFKQLHYCSPPLLLLFFVRSGMAFQPDALFDVSTAAASVPLPTAGLLYFVTRIAGKYAGAFLGCVAVRKSNNARNDLCLALIPQAGVAIGLAPLGARTLCGEMGDALETIILASSVLNELLGSACAKLSLYLSGSYVPGQPSGPTEPTAPRPVQPQAESLITRVQQIQEKLPERNRAISEKKAAFLDAAEEQFAVQSSAQRYLHNKGRYL